jgi:5-oxoprolinase (ATP-hydrolysing) subunit A
MVLYQAGAIEAFARAAGAKLHHVKCHGALYNMSAMDAELSDAIARAVRDLGGSVQLYALSNSRMMDAGRKHGLTSVGEVFADRGYMDDGTLAPRGQPGGMIEEASRSVAQVLSMVNEGVVVSLSGKRVPVTPDTLCLHGDQPGAVAFATALRQTFAEQGIALSAP